MMTANMQYEWVTRTISQRLADLLKARVYVVDDTGRPVAGSGPEGGSLDPGTTPDCTGPVLRIPMHFKGHSSEVLVQAHNEELISPRTGEMLVSLLISQMLATAHLHDRHDLKNKFIHDLLHGGLTDEAYIVRQAEILGMDLTRPRAVILIEADYLLPISQALQPEALEARTQRRAQQIIHHIVRFFSLPSDAICAYIGDGQIAVLKASGTQDLAAWADTDGGANPSWTNLSALKRATASLLTLLGEERGGAASIGIGRYHPGILGLASSYKDAKAALTLGVRFYGANRVHCLDELGSAAFVGISDENTKRDLARHLLSPLDQEPDLLDTLKVFLAENCCPASASARLCVHRNTLLYRLNKVKALTGLDPHQFQDAVQIHLALVLRELD